MAGGQKNQTHPGAIVRPDHFAESLWIYDKKLRGATAAQIAIMAKAPANVLEDGRYDNAAGLGKEMSISTVSRRLREVLAEHAAELAEVVPLYRAMVLDQYDAQLTRIDADLRRTPYTLETRYTRKGKRKSVKVYNSAARHNAEALLLRNLEARRKLLGLDSPIQVEAEMTVTHVDGTSIELAKMVEAAERKAKKTLAKAKRKDKARA